MMSWTPQAVKAALVDAFECDFLTGGRIGPKQFGSSMPDYSPTEIDYFVIERVDLEETGGVHWREMTRDRDSETVRHRRLSAAQISRMEFVLLGGKDENGIYRKSWLAEFLQGVDGHGPRNCIEVHGIRTAFWNLREKQFNAKRLCKRIGWNYHTYMSRRDRAAEIMAWKLNDNGIGSWIADGGADRSEAPAARPTLAQNILTFVKDEPKAKSIIVSEAVSEGWLNSDRNARGVITAALDRLVVSGEVAVTSLGRYRRT